jgi:hypothetical protein
MTEKEARMSAVIGKIADTYEPFTSGDSIVVLENLFENPYGVTSNEDVGRLTLTMSQAIAILARALAIAQSQLGPNAFGVFQPVQKGKQV